MFIYYITLGLFILRISMKQMEILPWIQYKSGIFMKLTSKYRCPNYYYSCKEMDNRQECLI